MKSISFIALSMMLSASAYAQTETTATTTNKAGETTETTIKKSDVVPVEAQVKDIDDEIKNKKLRAELGSKKKFSMSASLSYNGGSVQKPLDRERPNYRSGRVGVETITSLGGSVALKYRLSERDNLSFGTGVQINTPFHNTGAQYSANKTTRANGKEVEVFGVDTPYLSYSRAFNAGGIQNIFSVGYSHTTSEAVLQDDQMTGSVSLSHTILGSPVEGLDIGVSVGVSRYIFSNGLRSASFADAGGDIVGETRSDYDLGIYPFLEYALTEKASFRTVFGYFNFDAVRGTTNFTNGLPYQSMGIGYSVTRDIYLYPNVQFIPNNIRGDLTNVALSTTVNL